MNDGFIKSDYSCKFTQNGTEGNIYCTAKAVIFSQISVSGEPIKITLTVTNDKYTIETESNRAEYQFSSGNSFPLALLGKELLTIASGQDSSAIVDTADGFISEITVSSKQYTLHSHKKI